MAMLKSPAAGVLMPVYALRHDQDLGIGDTAAMKHAIDFCAKYKFRVLQTLPIHDTLGDNSPYNPVSAYALTPQLLSLEVDQVPGLAEEILREHADLNWIQQLKEGPIKYDLVRALKQKIFVAAYENWLSEGGDVEKHELKEFEQANEYWLPAYSLFRTIASQYDYSPDWGNWKLEHRSFSEAEKWFMTSPDHEKLSHYRNWTNYVQWVAHRQWSEVKAYADEKGILLMGEMSYGVSKSSVDVWAHPHLFDLEWSMGTRPVAYFDTNKDSEQWGQNWGFPPYRWENHRSEQFAWLRQRIESESKYFHIVRLDHLRGYFRAYMFPWQGGAEHAEYSLLTPEEAYLKAGNRSPRFVPGPDEDPITANMNELQGRELISQIQDAAKDCILFGELMGELPDYMRRVLDDLEVANLSFPLLSTNEQGQLRPSEELRKLSLISYGNHDHASLAEYYQQLFQKAQGEDAKAQQALENLLHYAKWKEAPPEDLNDELLAELQDALFQTPQILANLSIADLLGIPLRFNLPGTFGSGTWRERLDMTLEAYEEHPVYGERIRKASALLQQSNRHG